MMNKKIKLIAKIFFLYHPSIPKFFVNSMYLPRSFVETLGLLLLRAVIKS